MFIPPYDSSRAIKLSGMYVHSPISPYVVQQDIKNVDSIVNIGKSYITGITVLK